MNYRLQAVRCLAAALVLSLAPAIGAAQDQNSKSAQLAAELRKMLDARKLDSAAAKLGTDEFIGALYFPGSQLLVVKARYTAYERMDENIAKKAYRDVYIDLNSASVPQTKVLISDGGADGLFARRRQNQLDTAEIQGKGYSFDGDWRKAKISEQEYMKAFQASDAEYVAMLEALVAEMKKTS
jgi:hypothetical protein